MVYGRPFPGRTASIGHHLANLLSCLRVGYLTTDGGRWSGGGYSLSVSLLHCSSDVRNADMKHNNKFRPISRPTSEYTSRVGSAPLRRVYEPRVEERHYYFYTQSGILGCCFCFCYSAAATITRLNNYSNMVVKIRSEAKKHFSEQ